MVSAACTPQSEKIKGLVLTLKFDGLLVLHELISNGVKDPMILLLPDKAGEPLADLELGEECSIGEALTVGGHLDLFECKNELTVHKVTHLFEEKPPLRLLTVLGHPAELDGSFNISLTGEHKGYEWAGLPG